ncbi:MAG TPA: hypothetical protein VMU78_00360 [Methylocella sp.]|nr:hypothetical protein [Methylocella sp.]
MRYINIPHDLRDSLERYGENVVSFALGAGVSSGSHGLSMGNPAPTDMALQLLIQKNRDHVLAWLTERRDLAERREQRLETLEWAVLAFVILGVITDLALLADGHSN